MSKPKKLVPLALVQAEMVFPDGRPAQRSGIYARMEKLAIKPVSQKINGKGWVVAHVTEEEARALKEDFKLTHWRKFKAAEKKS